MPAFFLSDEVNDWIPNNYKSNLCTKASMKRTSLSDAMRSSSEENEI